MAEGTGAHLALVVSRFCSCYRMGEEGRVGGGVGGITRQRGVYLDAPKRRPPFVCHFALSRYITAVTSRSETLLGRLDELTIPFPLVLICAPIGAIYYNRA